MGAAVPAAPCAGSPRISQWSPSRLLATGNNHSGCGRHMAGPHGHHLTVMQCRSDCNKGPTRRTPGRVRVRSRPYVQLAIGLLAHFAIACNWLAGYTTIVWLTRRDSRTESDHRFIATPVNPGLQIIVTTTGAMPGGD
jgi:hypothetical protein